MKTVALEREFGDLLADVRDHECSVAEGDLASIPAELAELSRRFVALDRKLLASNKRSRLTSETDAMRVATFEMTRIRALHGVAAIAVRREQRQLVVDTHPLELEWNGHYIRIGRYRLTIGVADGDVRIESIDHLGPKSHWDHPHVQGGMPCLGNLREGVLKLIAEYELALAVQVLLDFLTTYDAETAYAPIEGWGWSA